MDIICEKCKRPADQHPFARILSDDPDICRESELDVVYAYAARLDAVIEAAKDVNEWLIRTKRKDTAHQKHLADALASLTNGG